MQVASLRQLTLFVVTRRPRQSQGTGAVKHLAAIQSVLNPVCSNGSNSEKERIDVQALTRSSDAKDVAP